MSVLDFAAAFSGLRANWAAYLAFFQAVMAAWQELQRAVNPDAPVKALALTPEEQRALSECANEVGAAMPKDDKVKALPILSILRQVAALMKTYPQFAALIQAFFSTQGA